MKVYCPCCGEWFIADDVDNSLAPGGKLKVVCTECGTVWNVVVEFYEVESEDAESHD